jgi:hypothetical protein
MDQGNIIGRIENIIDLIEFDKPTLVEVHKELKSLVEDIEEFYQGYDEEFDFDDLD